MTGRAVRPSSGEGDGGHDHDDDGHGHVDPEGPAPGEVVGEQAAEQRPDDGGDAEDGAECALVAAAFAQRDDLADHSDSGDGDGAAAEALQCARGDEHGHRSGEAAEHRSGEEDEDGGLEHFLAAEGVAELADDGGDDRRGQQVTGDDPRLVAGAAEVGDDGGQGGGHDGLVEGGQQHAEHDRQEDDVAALHGHRSTRCRLRGWSREPRWSGHALSFVSRWDGRHRVARCPKPAGGSTRGGVRRHGGLVR